MKKGYFKKNKRSMAIILLLLSFALIVGFSVAFFSDAFTASFSATAGTVKIKANGSGKLDLLMEQDPNGDDTDYDNNMLPGSVLNWNPGDVTTIEWHVENAGNKSIYTKNTLLLAWNSDTDLKEQDVIYLYPVTMSDDEIREDILNNNAALAIYLGDDLAEIVNDDLTTTGFVRSFYGDILDGTGFSAETGDAKERNLDAPFYLSDDGDTTKDVIRFKLAFSPTATNEYQQKSMYVGLQIDAIQYRNNNEVALDDDNTLLQNKIRSQVNTCDDAGDCLYPYDQNNNYV